MRIHPLLAHIVDQLSLAVGVATSAANDTHKSEWSNRDAIDFLDTVRRQTGDECMGLAGAPCLPGAGDFAMELGARCETLREAVDCNCRFMAIATKAFSFGLEVEDEEAVVTVMALQEGQPQRGLVSDWIMISWHKLMQWLIGSEIALRRAEFDHALEIEYRHYASMFGGGCQFNRPANLMAFDAALLDRKVVREPLEAGQLKASTPGYFEKPGLLARSWRQLTFSVLRKEIAEGASGSSTDELGRQFGITGQTLRRRLRAEGTSIRKIKSEVRLDVARDLLGDEAVRLGEASIAAGFSEPNSLARSLRSSRGIKAGELRDEVRSWRSASGSEQKRD